MSVLDDQGRAPANVDAERAILGGILLDPQAYEQAAERLRVQDFVLDSHRRIYGRMGELAKAGTAIDTITLLNELSRRGETETVGGVAYVTSLTDGLPRRPNLQHYVRIVREYAGKRFVAHACEAITAHARDGASIQELVERFTETGRQVAEYGPSTANRITNLRDIPNPFDLRSEGTRWLLPPILPRGEIVVLASEPGIGKTYLALAIARAVGLGAPFLNAEASVADVLYLDRENPLGVILDRLEILFGGSGGLRPWGSWCQDPPPMIGDPRLLEFAKQSPLIVFDSLIRFHAAENENDAAEMSPVMAQLRVLANAGATLLVLHHRGKSETSLYRGSSDIGAGADVVLALSKRDDLLELRTVKTRHSEVNLTIRADFAAGTFDAVESPAVVQRRDDLGAIEEVIRNNPGICTNNLIDKLHMNRTATSRLLRAHEGKLWRSETGTNRSIRYFPVSGTGCAQVVPETSGTTRLGGITVPAPLGAVPETTAVPGIRDAEGDGAR